MKVALISPPTIGNQFRGTGVYVRRLVSELTKVEGLEIEQLDFNFWKWDYSHYDLVHFLYFDPFFLTFPPFRNQKTIVSVMDLTTIVLKDLYPRGIKGEIKWQIQKFLLKKADRIITISNSAAADIARIINYPSDKITVTHLAPSEISQTAGKSLQLEVKKKYNLPDKFGLYVGDINANKNLLSLVEALPLVANPNFKLVLVGSSLTQNIPEAEAIRKKIAALRVTDKVIVTGFVKDQELVAIYTLATMFIHPAIYEGFGLGPLQALSMGLPTICGKNSSLPEVVGDAALFADVSNPKDLAQKMSQILNLSPREREVIKEKSLNQAKKFNWEKTAKKTVEAYGRVSKTRNE